MSVDFGGVHYVGTFHVVPGHIPLILGMSFLGEMSPTIDWQQKTVFLRNKKLHTVKLQRPRVVDNAVTRVTNSFEGLGLLDDVIGDDDSVGATQVPEHCELKSGDKPHAAGVACGKPHAADSSVRGKPRAAGTVAGCKPRAAECVIDKPRAAKVSKPRAAVHSACV